MAFKYSKHALNQMAARQIPVAVVEGVLSSPGQTVAETSTKVAYQSTITMDGKEFLVRVIVANDVSPNLVVTVYRTTRIEKYWRET